MANPSPILPTDNSGSVTPGKLEGGSFGVTPDGAATYTLPLWVPVGRRNIEPELALHYNSRGGNGLLGVGWSLTGIPRITRRRRTIADEGVEGPIRFDKDDPFALDGEPLVLVAGIHAVDGAEYRTKRDTFTKIILRDVDSAPDGHILGPTWFEAFHKDGRIFTFGGIGAGDLGSRFEGMAQELIPVAVPPTTTDRQAQQSVAISNRMVRYAWGLQSVRDRSDNMLIVYYEGYPFAPGAPPLPRDFIPTRIEYTGSPSDGTPALRSVDFIWEDRPDLETRLVSGLRVTQNKRLAELRMSGPDPTSADPSNVALLRRYAFAYKTTSVSGRSLLASVQELDGAGIAKGVHTFEWELGQTSFREIATGVTDIKTTPIGRSRSPGRIRVADFDGDGRDDILYVPLTDPDHFYILRSDPSSPTGFLAPYNTKIPVPANVENGRVYVYPDPAGDFMNIFVLDDSALPGTPGSPTYRVYHAGIDRSGASGSIGSFWVFPGRSIFDPSGSVEGPVEVVDLDGDGLPDLLHGYTGGGGPEPVWYMRANQGGNLNFDNEQLIGLYPFDHLAASLDGGSAAGLLVDASGMTGGDPRYSVLRVKRQGANVSSTVTLGTLLRDQQYVFGDFTGSGLPSAFSLGNAALSDTTLAENLGGSFGMPIPFVMNLRQPPSEFTPSLRVFDWNQDGHATLLARTRSAVQLNDPMFVFRWDGAGFTPTQLPFTSSWDLQFPAQFDVFEVMDFDGNGLDDVVMFSNGQVRVFVREGNRADMLTGIVDGLGARTSITYAPISDPVVHTPTYGYTFPQRAMTGKVWVVSEYRDDNGIGGVNTHRYTYQGGIEDVTGLGFLGFHGRTSVHVETGVTTTSTYFPDFIGFRGVYPLLGLPTVEVTTTPLAAGQEHVATTHTTYAVRPGPLGAVPYFVFPISVIEEQVINANGVPITPVRRRTITQDMDAFGNVITYAEVWSDGNKQTTTSAYSNNPATWLVGLLTEITEQSTAPSGVTHTRKRAYEYDAQGLVSREIIEPGPKGPTGYLPLGPQPDGVKTLYRTFERYGNGNLYRTILEESMGPTGEKRSTTVVYDDLEHLFPVDISDDLSHRVRATYHPGLAVQTSYTEPNGAQTFRQYDGFGRLRDQLAADGSHFSTHYLDAAGKLLITLIAGSGEQMTYTHDVLGRIVAETRIDRDDGAGALREIEYDPFGRAHRMSRPHFAADSPAYTVFAYDALGRITSRVGANGTSVTYEYRGEWVITTDGEGNAVAMRIDNLERPVFVTDRDATLVGSGMPSGMAIAYGPFNVTATVTDIAGNVSKRSSDRLGRPIEIVDPDRGHLTHSYNAFGDPVQDTRGSGEIVTYEYDPVGRLTAIRDARDGDVTFTWDTAATGKVTQIAAPASGITIAFTYDAAGRPVTKHWTIGTDSYSLTRVFDSAGRLAGVTYPAVGTLPAFTLQYEYGKFGQLLRAKDGATNDIYWHWVSSDATGRFGDDELGNGLVDRWIEDDARPGVLKSIQTLDKHEHLSRDTIYGFDANLNLTRRDDKVLNTKEAFTYDTFKRLKHWTWHGSAGSRRVRWDYDDIGNLQLRAIEAGPGADLAYTYNAAIAGPHAVIATTLGAYTYDARGNQASAPGRVVTFGRGDLPTKIVDKRSKAIDFLYDGEGARVRTIDQRTGLTTDTLDRLYEFRRPTGGVAPDGDHVFVIMVRGRLVARRTWRVAKHKRVADRLEYLHADHQQSIELVTSSHGKVLERLKYEPYGRRVDIDDPAKPHQERNVELHTGYTGHEHLDGHHLIDMRGRVYDPIVAKFLSADPTVSNPLNPQAWNRYAYVLDNPLSLRDPTGFQDDDEDDPNKYHSVVRGDRVVVQGATTRITFGTGSTVIGQGPVNQTEKATPGGTGIPAPRNPAAAASPAPAPTAASKPQQTPPPPPPPPKNDDGQGGAAQSGLPPNAGIAQGDRGRANQPDRDPAELFLRLDRERAAAYQSHAPFANPTRAKFQTYFFGGLEVLLATPLVVNGLWFYSGYALAEGGGSLVLSSKSWVSVMAFFAALGPRLHHVLPTEFVEEYEAAGINSQLFTIRIPQLLHVALHLEWNPLWRRFFEERGGEATAEEIAEFAGFLMERYGLWGFGWHVYPRMFTGR